MQPSINLPELPLAAWEDSKVTINLYLQVVGKIQLALMPRRNHWWNITFLVNSKGLITHTMPADGFTFEIQFNFLEHQLEIATSSGGQEHFALEDGLSVADFYDRVFALLHKLGITANIIARPYSIPDVDPITTPFAQLTQYHRYQPAYVKSFFEILVWTADVFQEFSGRFYGKTSPVQLFWHHMDLVVTRFCGRRAPALPADSNVSNKDAYSHELISFGFWAGDENVRGAAYYSYTYPSPENIDQEPLQPAAAKWKDANGSPMALLMYDYLRAEVQPRQALLGFLESTYTAGAKLCNWEMDDLYVPPLKTM